jgi:hypothetical protein
VKAVTGHPLSTGALSLNACQTCQMCRASKRETEPFVSLYLHSYRNVFSLLPGTFLLYFIIWPESLLNKNKGSMGQV